MAVVWIHINCTAGTLFIQHQCFSLKNFAKQQRSLYVTAIWVGCQWDFGGEIWLAAVHLHVGMSGLTTIIFTCTLCYRTSELALSLNLTL